MKDLLTEIIDSLNNLGGQAHTNEVAKDICERNNIKYDHNFYAKVEARIEASTNDSKVPNKKHIFFKIDEKTRGFYGLVEPNLSIKNMDATQDDDYYVEGKKAFKTHIVRERNHKVIKDAKERFIKEHGKLYCEVCGFDFTEKYGELGKSFIEAHHLKPVSELKEGEKTNINDLVMVCSNCHSMIHRYKGKLLRENLKSILKE